MGTKNRVLTNLSYGLTCVYLASCSQADSNQIVSKQAGGSADKVLASDNSSNSSSNAAMDPNTHPKVEAPVDPNAKKVVESLPQTIEPPPVVNSSQNKVENAALLASGKMITQYNVKNAISWGTSAATPIVVKVPVTAAGTLIVPPTLPTNQQAAGVRDTLTGDGVFAGVNSLYAGIKFCNDTTTGIQLHSSGNGPVNHGNEIAAGACQIMMVVRGLANNGATYDHKLGAGKGSVFIKLVKVLPDGSEMP